MTQREQDFQTAYNAGRNGTENFYRHSLVSFFHYSDGVRELAQIGGCYWLLDIIATEALKPLREAGKTPDGFYPERGIIQVVVKDGKADINMTTADDEPPIWSRHVAFTDMPAGDWKFLLQDEEERFAMILLSEY